MISVRAVTILSAYSEQESDFKLLPLVRDLLDQHPDEWIMTLTLIDILAHKGDRADISRLLKYCDHVSYAHLATVGLARLNVLLALEKCRKQIDRFGRLSKVAGWDYMLLVSPYLDLIFWQGDRTLVPSLELALAQMRKIADDDPVLMTDQLSLLIRYLDTDSMDQRAQLASRFVQRYHSDPQGWIREVHTKLTAAGADAELCKSLILPRPIRTHGGGLLSGDLEPQ